MTVDTGPIGDRLRPTLEPGTAEALLADQLHGPMADEAYAVLASAIVRAMAARRTSLTPTASPMERLRNGRGTA